MNFLTYKQYKATKWKKIINQVISGLYYLLEEQIWLDSVPHIGRFHTSRRTNRLDWQIVSDAQIVRCENGTNKFSDDFVVWICPVCLSVCEDDFLKTICPSRRTSRPKSDLNSHSDGLRRTNGRFTRLGGMVLAKGDMVCGKFAWKLAELAILNSH